MECRLALDRGHGVADEAGRAYRDAFGGVEADLVVPELRMGDKLVRGTEHRRIALEGAAVEGGFPSRVGAGNAGVAGETAAADGEGSAYPAAFHPQGLAGLESREAEGSLASLVVGDGDSVPGLPDGVFEYEHDAVDGGSFRLDFPADDQTGSASGLDDHPRLGRQDVSGLQYDGTLKGIGAFGFGQDAVEVPGPLEDAARVGPGGIGIGQRGGAGGIRPEWTEGHQPQAALFAAVVDFREDGGRIDAAPPIAGHVHRLGTGLHHVHEGIVEAVAVEGLGPLPPQDQAGIVPGNEAMGQGHATVNRGVDADRAAGDEAGIERRLAPDRGHGVADEAGTRALVTRSVE